MIDESNQNGLVIYKSIKSNIRINSPPSSSSSINNNSQNNKQKKEADPDDNGIELLKEWGLDEYTKILMIDNNYKNARKWRNLEISDLVKIGFKEGHAKRLIRKANEYFTK